MSEDGGFSKREVIWLCVLACALAAVIGAIFYPSTLEDAFITFRYAQHLAEGYGVGAWNRVGERVEGYTTLSWMLLLAGAHKVGVDIRTAAKVVGMFLHLLMVVIFILFPLITKTRSDSCDAAYSNSCVLAGVFLATWIPLAWYASSGMETVPFAALTGLLFVIQEVRHSSFWVALLCAVLILTRPEGMLMAAGGFLLWARRQWRTEKGAVGAVGTLLLLTMGALLAYRLMVFGDVVPNPYWAKVGGPGHFDWGKKYVRDWAYSHGLLVMSLVAGAWYVAVALIRGQREDVVRIGGLLSFLALYIAYIMKVGGDPYSAFPYWRHFVHIGPLVAIGAAYGIVSIAPRKRAVQVTLVLVVVMTANVSVVTCWPMAAGSPWRWACGSLALRAGHPGSSLRMGTLFTHETHNPYYLWLKQIADKGTTIASALGGELPYVVDAVHIDSLGLSTRHVARFGTFDPNGPQDSKTDMGWVVRQRPDIIEGFMPGTKILAQVGKEEIVGLRRKMNLELVTTPLFHEEYMFLTNGPYQHLDRALFLRREFCDRRGKKFRLECVPIGHTVLGEFRVRESN